MNEQGTGQSEPDVSRVGRRISCLLVAVVTVAAIVGVCWWSNRPVPPSPALDMLVTANNDRIRLFRNEMTLPHNYLRVELRARDVNRDAIGAELLLEMDEGSQRRWVMPTRSYLSQVELPVTFGLGTDRRPVNLSITWPDGSKQVVTDLPINRQILIEQAAESVEAR
jgi:hypothetical protein